MVNEFEGTRIINGNDVVKLVDIDNAIESVEAAFREHAKGEVEMPPKSYVHIPSENGDFRSMPAATEGSAGVKWVNVHPDNGQRFDLPTVMGLIIYSDPASGYPLAVIDGTNLTRIRTGAAAGVATNYLAHKNASSLGLLGAGEQAHTQLAAIATVRDINKVVVSDLSDKAVSEFIQREETTRNIEMVKGSPKEVAGCDVISTTTPSREPILLSEWVDAGTHINAMGADAEGKQELATELVQSADVTIDDWEQCAHSGEINVPTSEGKFNHEDIYGTLGKIIEAESGRPDNSEVSIFDSTGLAVQDIAVAAVAHDAAVKAEAGCVTEIVNN